MCIRDRDQVLTKNSAVCIKHFQEPDISRTEKYKNADSEWKEFPRNTPVLLRGAVPQVKCFLRIQGVHIIL